MLRRVMMAALLSAVLAAPALAQYRRGDYPPPAWAQQGAQRYERERPDPRHRDRDAYRRDDGGDRRRALTPDERRELNRDLQRANREIYRKGRER